MEIERHQCDLRIVELTESLKSEKTTNDRNIEAINREKECDIQKITDEVQQLRQEMTRAEQVNEELQIQLKEMKTLRDKYEDLKAEWMTLKQTNMEYKRTLGEKVKEGFKYQKDFDLFKAKNDLLVSELSAENDQRLKMITELQQERDELREHVCSLESTLTIKERELKKAFEMHDDVKDRLQRELRTLQEEV